MAFRADEAARSGYERAERYLIPRGFTGQDRARSQDAIADITDACGPVIETYPTWHPLVAGKGRERDVACLPRRECGYLGLDHTVYFANGFVTCPYGDGQKVIESVKKLPPHPVATITAERIDAQLYNPEATPILVKCTWDETLPFDGVPKSLVIPLLLEQELPCWRWAEVAETWESMRPYFLGNPCGKRSSLFVNQETGQTIKKIWNELIYTGRFGPIKV